MNDLLDKLNAQGLKVETVGDILANSDAASNPPGAAAPLAGIGTPPSDPGNLILVFDTETTGVPIWNEPSDSAGQPHVIELAMLLCTEDGEVVESYDQIINVGVPVPAEAAAVNGITDEMVAQGIPPEQALADFLAWVDRSRLIVGFATSFDVRMMRIMAARHRGDKWDCPIPKEDVKYAASSAYKIINGVGTKALTLKMAFEKIIGEPFDEAHRALADAEATRRLFFHLRPDNARAAIGGNNPPADEPEPEAPAQEDDGLTPFERVKVEIEDLYAEAKQYLDGEPIANEAQAADVAKLREKIRDAESRAEKMRKAEAEPFDKGKAEVQGRYNPLIQDKKGKTHLAIAACNDTLKPWLRKIENDQRAEAARAAALAEGLAREARQAALAAGETGSLEKRETAESILAEAKTALAASSRATATKPQVSGATRAVGMKSVFTAELIDPAKAIEHYRAARPAQMKQWLRDMAAIDVREGKRDPDAIPGFTIKEDRVPV